MKKIYNVFNLILSIIQIIFVFPALILESLSKKKMGVIRYLVFKKQEFSQGFFSADKLIIYRWIILLIVIIIITIFIVNIRKKKLKNKLNFVILIVLNFILYFFVSYEKILNLEAYHFFVIEIFIIILIEYIKWFISMLNNKHMK